MRFPPLLPTYSPSWMWPKTCSRGWTRLWTVLSSSTQPTRCIFLGTQSRKPVWEDKALRGTAGVLHLGHLLVQTGWGLHATAPA